MEGDMPEPQRQRMVPGVGTQLATPMPEPPRYGPPLSTCPQDGPALHLSPFWARVMGGIRERPGKRGQLSLFKGLSRLGPPAQCSTARSAASRPGGGTTRHPQRRRRGRGRLGGPPATQEARRVLSRRAESAFWKHKPRTGSSAIPPPVRFLSWHEIGISPTPLGMQKGNWR